MKTMKLMVWAAASSAALLSIDARADELLYSGFMSDYTQLEKVTDGSADYRYLPPGSEDRMAQYNAVMIDQPEVFIAADSEYRGAKPKHLEALAETMRSALTSSLSENLGVVDAPGENVLYVTLGITNLKLEKKKKNILGYTPVGLVGGAVVGAATTDLAKKATLEGLVLELEAFDSVSGERIVAIIDHLGSDDAGEDVSWDDLEVFMERYGRIMQCRFDNARLPAEQRANCLN